MRHLTDELHIHLYGCLRAEDLWLLGRDRYRHLDQRLAWYAEEYRKAYAVVPDYAAYWDKDDGFDRLKADFEFVQPGPFGQFQARFNLLVALLPIVPEEPLVLRHVLRAQRDAGIRYAEYRCFTPPMLSPEQVRTYVETWADAAFAIGEESAGSFEPRLAFSLSRNSPEALVQHAAIRAALNTPARTKTVVGLDFCGAEEGHPPLRSAATFQAIHAANAAAKDQALAILYHVGEAFDGMTVMSAMRWIWQAHSLGAHRLGHATALGINVESLAGSRVAEQVQERLAHLAWLVQEAPLLANYGYLVPVQKVKAEAQRLLRLPADAWLDFAYTPAVVAQAAELQTALAKDLKARGATIESCPTSNFRIGRISNAADHPLPRFVAAGLTTVVSSDDPGIFASPLASEEALCRSAFGFSATQLASLQAANETQRSACLVR